MFHSHAAPQFPASRLAYCGGLLLLVVFCAFCWMNVIPFGDEAQQFPRALHTLYPNWLDNDLFVGAPQGDHWVFFQFLAGLFWLGGLVWGPVLARVVIWTLMAASLFSLGRALQLRPLAVLVGTALFVAYGQARFGGESVIGEAIARHLAYPIVLFALAAWMQNRFLLAACLLGLATSVHALVGVWATAAILGLMFFDREVRHRGWGLRITLAAAWLVCASPGLLLILPIVLGGDQSGASQADPIFIYFRHPHHLSPGSWPLGDYLEFALVFAAFLVLVGMLPASSQVERLKRFVWVITVITIISLFVGLVLRPAFFLKLHPYRFAPPLTCLMAALLAGQMIASLRISAIRWGAALAAAALALWLAPHGAIHLYRNESHQSDVETARADALHWLKEYSPANAAVMTNPAWSDVQWVSRRAAVSSFKLIPFEVPRINEWYRRLTSLIGQPQWSQPGQDTLTWIRQAYDEADTDQLLRIAGQLGADFAVTNGTCRASSTPAYSNSHFCIYSTGNRSTLPDQKYLVVRYDDYSPTEPKDGSPRSMETENRLFDLAEKHHAKVTVGVIPFPISSESAAPRNPAETTPDQSWLSHSESPWVQLLQQGVNHGVVEAALHGFEHRVRNPSGYRKTEYRNQPAQWQSNTMRLGRDVLTSALQRPVHVFVPPWNAWDEGTVQAQTQLDIDWISPDQHQADGLGSKSLKVAPQGTADPIAALAAMKSHDSPPGTVLVLVTHPFDFEKSGGEGEAYFHALEDVFAYAESSPDWTSAGFASLPENSAADWTSRFRAAVSWNQQVQLLADLPGCSLPNSDSAALLRPVSWYQDNLWRPRLPFITALLAGVICAGLLARFLAQRLDGLFPSSSLGLIVSLLMTFWLAFGAWQTSRHDFAIRGLRWLAICITVGATLGFAWGAIGRRRHSALRKLESCFTRDRSHRATVSV